MACQILKFSLAVNLLIFIYSKFYDINIELSYFEGFQANNY